MPNPTRIGLTSLVAAILLAASLRPALADVPRLVHYQGKLLTSAGAAVNGPVSVRIRLYDSSTAATPVLLDETHPAVTVTRGLFSLAVGSLSGGITDAALAPAAVYLGVAINGDPELAPRTRIITTPYSVKTRSAEQLVRPDTMTPAVTVDGGGRVGIGASPTASAAFQVDSTSGGTLITRMTSNDRDLIASPAAGLLIYNTTTNCFNFYTGTTWLEICGNCLAPAAPTPGNDGPLCSGSTLNLTASTISGATYAWTGPNNFTSSDQNPSIANATTANAGAYTVTATVNGCTSAPATTVVIITNCFKTVFVSSTTTNGNFGGLSGGDAFCQALADTAGLAGAYKAWLSTNSTSVADRFTHASVPYKLITGTTLANGWDDLVDGNLAAPIDRDEYGNTVSATSSADCPNGSFSHVWTGTGSVGAVSLINWNCNGWTTTGTAGYEAGRTNTGNADGWSSWCSRNGSCGQQHRVYCFEQ